MRRRAVIVQAETPRSRCVGCGVEVDAATGIEGRGPVPGDRTVCYRCATPAKFDAAMQLVPLDPDELEELAQDDFYQIFRRRVLERRGGDA